MANHPGIGPNTPAPRWALVPSLAGLLERHVPDHRRIVSGPAPAAAEAEDERQTA